MDRKQQAYAYLKNAIVNNEIFHGTAIRELGLTKKLSMSRTPIREAMRELEKDGLLVSYPARGTFVVSVSASDVSQIYDLRILHELWALEQGIMRIQDKEIAAVDKLMAEAEREQDWEKFHASDVLLHGFIVEKSYNKRLVAFVNSLNVQIERIRRFNAKDTRRYALGFVEHRNILEALMERDLDAAKRAVEVHLRASAITAIEVAKRIEMESSSQHNNRVLWRV